MSLLQKAKKSDGTRGQVVISKEHMELAIAFLKEEVSISGATVALGHKQGSASAYITITRALKDAYRKGLITVTI